MEDSLARSAGSWAAVAAGGLLSSYSAGGNGRLLQVAANEATHHATIESTGRSGHIAAGRNTRARVWCGAWRGVAWWGKGVALLR